MKPTTSRTLFIIPMVILVCLGVFFAFVFTSSPSDPNVVKAEKPVTPENVKVDIPPSNGEPIESVNQVEGIRAYSASSEEGIKDEESSSEDSSSPDNPSSSNDSSPSNEEVGPQDKADASSDDDTPTAPDEGAPSDDSANGRSSSDSGVSDGSKDKGNASPKKVTHYGNKVSVRASSTGSTSIVNVNGIGSVRMVFSRNSSSSAPNLPTYVSVLCGASSVYSGAFNSTTGETFSKRIPFSGSCKIITAVRYPSSRWTGSANSVSVSYGDIKKLSGQSYSSQAGWKTVPVSSSRTFHLNSKKGLKGFVILKLTSCSSSNGASDKTAKNACDGYVKKDVGSSGFITIKDGNKTVVNRGYNITYKKHHDTITIPIPKTQSGSLSITVKKKNGSAVLVHGTGGSSLIGAF